MGTNVRSYGEVVQDQAGNITVYAPAATATGGTPQPFVRIEESEITLAEYGWRVSFVRGAGRQGSRLPKRLRDRKDAEVRGRNGLGRRLA